MSPYFGARDRLLSMYSRSSLLSIYRDWLIDAILPFSTRDGVLGYHTTDVLILGSNPILGAILCRSVAREGLSVIVGLTDDDDAWPYDLAASNRGADFIEAALDLPAGSGSPQIRVRKAMRSCTGSRAPNAIRLLPSGTRASLARRQHDGEVFLYATSAEAGKPTDPVQRRLTADLRSALSECPVLSVPSGPRATGIFARHVLLTARIEGFGNSVLTDGDDAADISWGDRITPFGSAAFDPCHGRAAARCMIEDVLRAARFR